jgi:hypothetical protein
MIKSLGEVIQTQGVEFHSRDIYDGIGTQSLDWMYWNPESAIMPAHLFPHSKNLEDAIQQHFDNIGKSWYFEMFNKHNLSDEAREIIVYGMTPSLFSQLRHAYNQEDSLILPFSTSTQKWSIKCMDASEIVVIKESTSNESVEYDDDADAWDIIQQLQQSNKDQTSKWVLKPLRKSDHWQESEANTNTDTTASIADILASDKRRRYINIIHKKAGLDPNNIDADMIHHTETTSAVVVSRVTSATAVAIGDKIASFILAITQSDQNEFESQILDFRTAWSDFPEDGSKQLILTELHEGLPSLMQTRNTTQTLHSNQLLSQAAVIRALRQAVNDKELDLPMGTKSLLINRFDIASRHLFDISDTDKALAAAGEDEDDGDYLYELPGSNDASTETQDERHDRLMKQMRLLHSQPAVTSLLTDLRNHTNSNTPSSSLTLFCQAVHWNEHDNNENKIQIDPDSGSIQTKEALTKSLIEEYNKKKVDNRTPIRKPMLDLGYLLTAARMKNSVIDSVLLELKTIVDSYDSITQQFNEQQGLAAIPPFSGSAEAAAMVSIDSYMQIAEMVDSIHSAIRPLIQRLDIDAEAIIENIFALRPNVDDRKNAKRVFDSASMNSMMSGKSLNQGRGAGRVLSDTQKMIHGLLDNADMDMIDETTADIEDKPGTNSKADE